VFTSCVKPFSFVSSKLWLSLVGIMGGVKRDIMGGVKRGIMGDFNRGTMKELFQNPPRLRL
jgi:hypothetical protein